MKEEGTPAASPDHHANALGRLCFKQQHDTLLLTEYVTAPSLLDNNSFTRKAPQKQSERAVLPNLPHSHAHNIILPIWARPPGTHQHPPTRGGQRKHPIIKIRKRTRHTRPGVARSAAPRLSAVGSRVLHLPTAGAKHYVLSAEAIGS